MSVVERQAHPQRTEGIVRVRDETSELMAVQGEGSLGKLRPQDRFSDAEVEKQYVEHLRKGAASAKGLMPEFQAEVARMRAEYENRGKA